MPAELPDTTQVRLKSQEPEQEQKLPDGGASLFVRLWTFGGPGQNLRSLILDTDPEIAALIHNFIKDGHGEIVGETAEGLTARFDDPLYALSTAKSLQQRLLTFHREQPPEQVVSSIFVQKSQITPGTEHFGIQSITAAPGMLDSNYSAQILVSESIYELAKNEPGFQFNSKPVQEAGAGGASETIYELLWTDESTYGHLRQAGQSTGIKTAGRYQIQAELGQGAMGIVYKAYDQLIGRTVALKTISISRNAPNRKELIERLKQEAKAAGGLDHPNIITIYDVGQEDDLVYLSMQFIEGKTLLALLEEGGLPNLPTLISYAEQICSAVGFAHARNVIHRDLKPANLMLTNQGVIKVLDFGIAKIEDATLTQTGLVVGTPTHMSPEQVGDKKIDHRSDIFALGSVFYELFTLEKPFKGDITTVLYKIMHEDPLPPSVINPGLPGGIDAIIRKALAKDPKDRFQNCEEMCKAFREQAALLKPVTATGPAAIKAATPASHPAASSPSHLVETTARSGRRAWPWLVTALLAAIIGANAWAFYVKAHTGSFPRLAQKLAAALHRKTAQATGGQASNTVAPAGQQPTQNNPAAQNSGSNPVTARSTESNSSDPVAANKPEAVPAPTPAANAGASPTPSQPDIASQSSATTQPPVPPPQNEKNQSRTEAAHGALQPPAAAGVAQTAPHSDSSATAQATGSSENIAIPVASPQGPARQSTASPGDNQDETAMAHSASTTAKKPAPRETARSVEGFSRRDVPDLLRQADAAAGRGDYTLARYEYNLILKLDRNNAAARTGLRRVQSAEKDLAQGR